MLAVLKDHGCEPLEGKTILEIGCGNGDWVRDFVQWGATPDKVYGVDLLGDRIRAAQRLNPNIHYVTANAEALDFPDDQFDIVIFATCLTSVQDGEMKQRIAREALRVLRSDGMILWYDFRFDNPWNPDVKGIRKKEIMEMFGNCSYCFHLVTLLPPLARALAPTSWLACEILARIPFLKTHYLVVMKKGGATN